ncbi:MAG: ZIP family metal transporter, partial [Corallincola sp.]|nr:ZIP family metal transporter [Corallincola sp.]
MILLAIVAATVAGGLLSVLAAATLSLTLLRRYANLLLSFAVGILLAATFLNLLPEALAGLPATTVGATLLASLILLFMLEKSLLWRHHHQRPERSDAGLKAGAAMVVVGDGLHNFVDGVLIAAAFLHDPALGWATATAVILHEIPQEVGDFMVLLAAG